MSDDYGCDITKSDLECSPSMESVRRNRNANVQPENGTSRSCDLRRDSSSSNDSQSCKKLASLNEIEDLYTALQDLVKTNVSNIPSTSPVKEDDEPENIMLDKNTSPCNIQPDKGTNHRKVSSKREKVHRKIAQGNLLDFRQNSASTRIRSNSFTTNFEDTKNMFEKKSAFRVASTSNDLGYLSTSPLRSRRLTSSNISNNCLTDAKGTSNRKTGRSISVGGRLFRLKDDSNTECHDNKKWKNKILSRIRSKTATSKNKHIREENSEPCDSPESRRYSQNDVENKYGGNTWENSVYNDAKSNQVTSNVNKNKAKRKESLPDVREIDQLVQALHLKVPEPNRKTDVSRSKSAESELSKLESWFEKAAAEVKRTSSDYDNDSDVKTPPTSRDTRRRAINRNKKASLKRNKSIHDPVKRERRMRQVLPNEDYVSNNINSFVRLAHAKSTPDLRDADNFCDSDDFAESSEPSRDSYDSDVSYDFEGVQQNGFYENSPPTNQEIYKQNVRNTDYIKTLPSKSDDRKEQKVSRRISLDENVRLPKTPLFYTPNDHNIGIEEEINIFEERTCVKENTIYNRPTSLPTTFLCNDVDCNSKNEDRIKMKTKYLSFPNSFPCKNTTTCNEESDDTSPTTPTNDNLGDLSVDTLFKTNLLLGRFWNDDETSSTTNADHQSHSSTLPLTSIS